MKTNQIKREGFIMSNLIPFNYGEKEVRTVVKDSEPWFVVNDVCNVLEFANPSETIKRLDEDEVNSTEVTDSLGRSQKTNIVNEAGLYSLILGSRKAEAKQFKRWITHEVIPSIRKHGVYATENTLEAMLNDPDTMIKTLTALKEEREKRKLLEETIEKDKPKVLFADAVATSNSTILIGELSKLLKQNGIDIGQNRLFQWLRENGYLIRRKGTDYNSPTQKAMELKLFTVKETAVTHSDGHVTVNKTTKVTGKGQQYFINKFLQQRAV
jgi:anti-repressor protein